MKKTIRTIAMLLALVMVLGLMAGCGKTEAPAAAPAEAPAKTEAAAAKPEAAAAAKDTLTVAMLDEVSDLNPFTNQQSTYVCMLNNNVIEGLVYMNGDMIVSPALATEWTISDDGLTYTFKLREGVKYHDGSDFTSEDVKFTLDYTMNPDNGCWRASSLAAVASVECPDDYTVILNLNAPSPALLDGLTSIGIVSSEQDAATYSNTLIGTGPFKFESYTTNDSIVLVKNEEFWDAANVKLNKVTMKFVADQATAITGLQSGDLDMLYALDASYAEQVEATDGLKVVTSPSSNTTYLFEIGLHNVEAFQEENVLKAMFMCLDTETIADAVFYGYAKPSEGVVHAGAKYFKDVYDNGYDIEAAKALLATTSYADGFEFTIYTLSGALENIALIWQQDLAQIGIDMKVEVAEVAVWLEKYLAREYDMICNYYSMVGTDPATMMNVVVAPLLDYQATEDIIPGLKDLINEGAVCANEAEREKIYGEIFDLMGQYMPLYTYLSVDNLYASNAALNGVEFNGENRCVFTYASFE